MEVNKPTAPTREEFFRVTNLLEAFSPLFSKVWSTGVPVWNEKITTAAVSMVTDKRNGRKRIGFHFNPGFWAELDDIQRSYVIAHEMLHLILNHLSRASTWGPDGNIAIDVAVNDTLDKMFGFPHPFDPNSPHTGWTLERFCQEYGQAKSGESAEYYYSIIQKSGKASQVVYVGFDEHGYAELNDSEETQQAIKNIAERLKVTEQEAEESIKNVAKEELEKVVNRMAGTTSGEGYMKFDYPPLPKRKWGDVIRKRLVRTVEKYREEDQWLRKPRRIDTFMDDKSLIPHLMETDFRVFDKLPVWLFQDTSGSCQEFAGRFFAAARSIPQKQFSVVMHCFDTQVYPTSLETGELYGFGGTSFSCIEDYIQQKIKADKTQYPAAVFVVTDGYGDTVVPEFPERWHWFLSHDYCEHIPDSSPVFMLDTFEEEAAAPVHCV